MRFSVPVVCLSALFFQPASQAQIPNTTPLNAKAYLEHALTELETKHVNRGKVDWKELKKEARSRARKAVTPADTYPAIDYVIEALGEKHTLLYEAPKPQAVAAGTPVAAPAYTMPEPIGELIDGRFGYIKIPTFGAVTDHPDSDLFIAMSRRILLHHSRAGACGWIVDVRGNRGGTIWPMVDGLLPLLAPLVGEGPYWFFDIGGKVAPITLKSGRLVGEGAPVRPAFETHMVKNAQGPIAILIDQKTASSGEGVANAFKDLPNVRYFGETTRDLVTVNNPVRLPDGAAIQMTVGYSRDRNGKLVTGPVEPDERTTSEGARDAALQWLNGSCSQSAT